VTRDNRPPATSDRHLRPNLYHPAGGDLEEVGGVAGRTGCSSVSPSPPATPPTSSRSPLAGWWRWGHRWRS